MVDSKHLPLQLGKFCLILPLQVLAYTRLFVLRVGIGGESLALAGSLATVPPPPLALRCKCACGAEASSSDHQSQPACCMYCNCIRSTEAYR